MSAKHALLGLLLDRPAYPYELGDRLKQRLGPAWDVNPGQLYQTITRLEQYGLIERVRDPVPRCGERQVFAITENGAAEFNDWFERPTDRIRLSRRPLLVKITLAGPERLRYALGMIDAYERDCAGQLHALVRRYETIAVDEECVRADHVLLLLNLSAAMLQLEAELRWARHASETVPWLLERNALWPFTRERAHALSDRQLQGCPRVDRHR